MKRYLLSIVLVIMLTLVTACGQNNSSAAPAQNGEAEKKVEAVQTGDSAQAAEAAQAAETMQGAEAAPAVDTAQAAEAAQADENGQTAEAAQADENGQTAEATQADDTAQAAETALAGDTAKAAETALTAEEQRRILEDNRSLWTFDQEDYSPDWYYAFTDLDHNGLLEVLAASTQGSGMFTYAHFYEVLPDGSGIKNLYHADEEVEGPDDWPEVVMESIPCYYDSSSDCYYYVCTNTTRDGAAHSTSQTAALSLKDGVAEWEYLACMDIRMTDSGEEKTSYEDAEGNSITEEDYNSVVEKRFAGMEQSEFKPEWTAVTHSSDVAGS